MKNTIIYVSAFLATVAFGIGSMVFMAKTPLQTRIITLENDFKKVKLYGMAHTANESFYNQIFEDFEFQKEIDYEIITEGYNTFGTPEGRVLELNLFSRIMGCDNLSFNFDDKNFIKQDDYVEKNKINYKAYVNDINIYQMFVMAPKKPEKSFICFEVDTIEKARVYFKLNNLVQKNSFKQSLLWNRDINLTNKIILSPKKRVAAYYGDNHLDYTTELLEKLGFKVKKIEYINAF
jgi:hypothetical protein